MKDDPYRADPSDQYTDGDDQGEHRARLEHVLPQWSSLLINWSIEQEPYIISWVHFSSTASCVSKCKSSGNFDFLFDLSFMNSALCDMWYKEHALDTYFSCKSNTTVSGWKLPQHISNSQLCWVQIIWELPKGWNACALIISFQLLDSITLTGCSRSVKCL